MKILLNGKKQSGIRALILGFLTVLFTGLTLFSVGVILIASLIILAL